MQPGVDAFRVEIDDDTPRGSGEEIRQGQRPLGGIDGKVGGLLADIQSAHATQSMGSSPPLRGGDAGARDGDSNPHVKDTGT